MAWRLSGTAGTWVLAEGEHLIGRDAACSLCIPDGRLSRKHARLVVTGDRVVIHDLGSANGVLRNGDRIAQPTALQPGDILVCGPVRLSVARDSTTPPEQQPTTGTLNPHGSSQSRTAEMRASEIGRVMFGEADAPPRLNPAIAAALDPPTAGPTTAPQTAPHSAAQRHAPAAHPTPGTAGPTTPGPTTATLTSATGPHSAPGSSTLHSSEMQPLASTSALSPNRFSPAPHTGEPHRTTSILPSEAPPQSTAALEANLPVDLVASRQARLLAGIGDPALCLLSGLLAGGLVALGGSVAALRFATAGFAAGQLVTPSATPAGAGDLAAYLLSPGTWLHLDLLASHLHHLPAAGPFAVLFLSWAAGAVLVELALLAGLVAMTVSRGGPWLHRRLGLTIVIQRNGHHPGWPRALWRWLLLALTIPIAAATLAAGTRGLHDRLSGCEVRRHLHQPPRHPPHTAA
jgi:hypothetical protein